MNILVTGGAGFIGSHLAEELATEDNTVYIYDDLSSGYENNLPDNKFIIFKNKKIQDESLNNFPRFECIYHLAAQASVPLSMAKFYESSQNNLLSTLKVFELAKEFNAPLVYASSSAVYGNLPVGNDEIIKYDILSPYALDKLTMEEYARLCFQIYGVKSIGLRFFNVYGPRQDPTNPYSGVISIFIDNFLSKKPVIINGGYQTRDFIYVKDIVTSLIGSMEVLNKRNICEVVNVGTGISTTIDELFIKLTKIFNYTPQFFHKELPVGDPEVSSGNFSRLRTILELDNENFHSMDFGLMKTVEFFLKNYVEGR